MSLHNGDLRQTGAILASGKNANRTLLVGRSQGETGWSGGKMKEGGFAGIAVIRRDDGTRHHNTASTA